MFSQPHINEMMARETIDYRVRDAESLRRGRAYNRRPQRRARRRIALARIRHAVRNA